MREYIRCLGKCAAIAGAALPLLAGVDIQSPPGVLRVEVYNVAGVRPKDLVRAEQEVAMIFAEAGVTTNWSDGPLDSPQERVTDYSVNGASSGRCVGGSQLNHIELQLLRVTPGSSTYQGVLGYALPCAKFGVAVTVYVDKCEQVMYKTWASFPKILAHVMAHEIGHVLLQSKEHSGSGIMSARWTKAQWQMAAAHHLAFLPEQGESLRSHLSVVREASGRDWRALPRPNEAH